MRTKMADSRSVQTSPLPDDTRELLVETLQFARQLIQIADQYKNGSPASGGGHDQTDAVTPSGELPPTGVCQQLAAAMNRALQFVQENVTVPEEVIKADVRLAEEAGRYAVLRIMRFFWRGITNIQPKSAELAAELQVVKEHLDHCQEMVPKIEDYIQQAAELCTQIMQCQGHDRSLQLAFDNVTRRADLELTFCEERLKQAEKKLNDLVMKVKTRKRDEGRGMTLIGSAAVLSAAAATTLLFAFKALTRVRASVLCSLTAIGGGLLLLNRADQSEYEKFLSELREHRMKNEQLQTRLQELKRRLESEVEAVGTYRMDERLQSPEPPDNQSEQSTDIETPSDNEEHGETEASVSSGVPNNDQ
ncbi:Hypp1887 [Branchiostoma lanceolatum]|uniref:Hypp1887 protein n=2 Tax=Branchiostoma lanceolatum TaxID=7740 RepID=A0A8J9ZLK8_BRALA|nr:Hypp1887 [Branchiostoma lanceolatum]